MTRTLAAAAALVVAVAVGAALWAVPTSPADARPAPELAGISAWLNADPLTMKGLRGKVVVVHFWTNGCINCVHNYPAYKAWHADFAGKGAVVLGVHTPEFEAEKNLDRLRDKVRKAGLEFPIAVDNDGDTWRAWGNQYWPAIYLVDKQGRVRYQWDGELGTDGERAMRRRIDALLAE